MRKKIFAIALSFYSLVQCCQGQTLYATSSVGGNASGGTITRFVPATNDVMVVKAFEKLPAYPVYTNLIQAGDGKLYGMTSKGGSRDSGVIFSFDPLTSAYTKLKDFDKNNGGIPLGSLVQARDGKMYGMTSAGGMANTGVIFSFDPVSLSYTKLKEFGAVFRNLDGLNPQGSLIQAADGKLYGFTFGGGTTGYGVMFSFDPVSLNYTKLKEFDGKNGARPQGSLLQPAKGKLYGVTGGGGLYNGGVIFSFDPVSLVYAKLKDFDGNNGFAPFSGLMQAKDGKLYGITSRGGNPGYGVIYSFDTLGNTINKLYDFSTKGGNAHGNLVQGNNGKLYGLTLEGGKKNTGVLFSFDPATLAYSLLKSFSNSEGAYPYGSPVVAKDGKLYGMTYVGGVRSTGVLFSFNPASSVYTVENGIGTNKDGSEVSAGLIQVSDGKLYGMTALGGRKGFGVIYSFDPSSSAYTTRFNFDSINGARPAGRLMQSKDGRLYGMTFDGGSKNAGVLFSFDPVTSAYIKLKDFDTLVYQDYTYVNESGGYPYGSLMQASDGKLYGMTSRGGKSGYGVIFSLDPLANLYTVLKTFDASSGKVPCGNLIQARDGKMYGMTRYGGAFDEGVIFSFDPVSGIYKKLNDLNAHGRNPQGSFLEAANGKLYGFTSAGGAGGAGVFFSFDPISFSYKPLYDFAYGKPAGSLMQASDGKLYGSSRGLIFSFDTQSSLFSVLSNYGVLNDVGSVFVEVKSSQPSVHLTAPANYASYITGTDVTLTATASDTDGTISRVEFYNGTKLLFTATDRPFTFRWEHVHSGNYKLIARAVDNNGISGFDSVYIAVAPNKSPGVQMTRPPFLQTFFAGDTVHLQATAFDLDGKVTRVEFYSDSTLLATEYKEPYIFDWRVDKAGEFAIRAKARDDRGAVTASVPVYVDVILNQPPFFVYTFPSQPTVFTAPASIFLDFRALDHDGTVIGVRIYSNNTLLTTGNQYPYQYVWENVPPGIYTVYAVARDNRGAETGSSPVTITVMPPQQRGANNEVSVTANKSVISDAADFQLSPNPAKSVLNIDTKGLQKNQQTTISVISSSGVIMKTLRANGSADKLQLNVSSLAAGAYVVKIISGDKVLYRRFVKM